jgi:ABC-type spermidine/putrescine transport system permease subunit I
MINHAVAPAFVLNGVAAMVAVLVNRISGVTERIRSLREIDESDVSRVWLKNEIGELRKRELLLNSALRLAVLAGIGVTFLLLFGFVVAFMGYRHEPGAAALFMAALGFLAASLVRLLQDIRLSQSEHDDHRAR